SYTTGRYILRIVGTHLKSSVILMKK
ncbi:T9SS C-terminal target domain-containing protein, partial [Bacteroides salyersiae]